MLGALMELSILQCKTGEAGPCASAIGRWGRVCMRFMGVPAALNCQPLHTLSRASMSSSSSSA